MQKRIQVLPTSLEIDRLAKSLDELAPDRVYILKNKEPVGVDEEDNEDATEELRELVKDKTTCNEDDGLIEREIEFYEFGDALMAGFEILYEESQDGNEIIVNVSGGTKPVAIALTYACSLVENGQPWYYISDKREGTDTESRDDGQKKEDVEEKVEMGTINELDISCVLPDLTETPKIRLLKEMLEIEEEEHAGVVDLVANSGKIDPEPPEDEEKKEKRERILQSHYTPAADLVEDGLAVKMGDQYRLTKTGKIIAQLVKVREEINGD